MTSSSASPSGDQHDETAVVETLSPVSYHSGSEVWTVVVGGGSGRRFGRPKQYEPLDGDERVIDRSQRVAEAATDGVILVVPAEDVQIEGGVAGGITRSDSVRAGLAALPHETDIDVVCVHDAARPFASPELYKRVIATVRAGADAAVPAIPVTDTIKVVDSTGRVLETPDRSTLAAVQTPQAFRLASLRLAHGMGLDGTDDAELVEAWGGVVRIVDGDPFNRKITFPDDLVWARHVMGCDSCSAPQGEHGP